MSPPRIAIVGAGPAGLTAGLLLHKRKIPFTIFELRDKPTPEELELPSGMLDMHEDSGLAAIRKCGLFDEFMPLTGDCSQEMKITEKSGKVMLTHGKGQDIDSGENRPEISRNALAEILLANLPADVIRWKHKLVSASRSTHPETGHTELELDFDRNGKQTFDLVIGADGAWSRVRSNLLLDMKPGYVGRQIVTVTIRQITKKYPHLAAFIGSGSFMAIGNGHMVSAQRGPQDSARIYIFLSTLDEKFATTSGLGDETAASAKKKILGDDALLGS